MLSMISKWSHMQPHVTIYNQRPYETVYNKQYANKYNKLWKMQEMYPLSLWNYLEQQVTTGHPIKDSEPIHWQIYSAGCHTLNRTATIWICACQRGVSVIMCLPKCIQFAKIESSFNVKLTIWKTLHVRSPL